MSSDIAHMYPDARNLHEYTSLASINSVFKPPDILSRISSGHEPCRVRLLQFMHMQGDIDELIIAMAVYGVGDRLLERLYLLVVPHEYSAAKHPKQSTEPIQ